MSRSTNNYVHFWHAWYFSLLLSLSFLFPWPFALVILLVIFINWFVSIAQLRGNDNNQFKRLDGIFQIPLMC